MELSKRLQAVADLLSDGQSIADVGTDHGYIPIYLVGRDRFQKAFAMDVNQGPLLRAKEHIRAYKLSDRIETRLSDGVKALHAGECEAIVVAGMGGALTVKILTEGEAVFRNLKEFVLQPQSEIRKVREYLISNGYRIAAEDMVFEDGKFYPMMRVEQGVSDEYQDMELLYGKCLLEDRHPVLKQFLEKEYHAKCEIQTRLQMISGEQIEVRRAELKAELIQIQRALNVYL